MVVDLIGNQLSQTKTRGHELIIRLTDMTIGSVGNQLSQAKAKAHGVKTCKLHNSSICRN